MKNWNKGDYASLNGNNVIILNIYKRSQGYLVCEYKYLKPLKKSLYMVIGGSCSTLSLNEPIGHFRKINKI